MTNLYAEVTNVNENRANLRPSNDFGEEAINSLPDSSVESTDIKELMHDIVQTPEDNDSYHVPGAFDIEHAGASLQYISSRFPTIGKFKNALFCRLESYALIYVLTRLGH